MVQPIVSVSVEPDFVSVKVGATHQMSAIATDRRGDSTDVTSLASWVSTDASIASVSSSGLVTGVAEGEADITASFGGQTSEPSTASVVPLRKFRQYAVEVPDDDPDKGDRAFILDAVAWKFELPANATIEQKETRLQQVFEDAMEVIAREYFEHTAIIKARAEVPSRTINTIRKPPSSDER